MKLRIVLLRIQIYLCTPTDALKCAQVQGVDEIY